MKKTFALAFGDWRNTARDSFLVMMLAVPFIITLVLRFGIPFAAEKLKPWLDLVPHYPFILSLMLFFPGMLYGAVVGFLLLDEKDEGILAYMAVTPLSSGGYLRYRIAAPTVVSFVMGVVLLPLSGLASFPFWSTLPLLLVASLGAPLMALFLAVFARNKVEGMALYKLSGLLLAGPALAWFVKSDWAWLGGVFPSFWVARAFFAATEGGVSYWTGLGAGLLLHLLVIGLLVRRFRRRG